jgi:hypothetical protein
MTATAATNDCTLTQAETGRALLQLVLDNHGPALGWTINGILMATIPVDPVASLLLDAAHLLLYGPPFNNRKE